MARKQTPSFDQRIAHFEQMCREYGLPLTVQRRTVLECVLEHANHPTADEVYDLARRHVPDISRTTVYRALETLVRIGVVSKACHPGAAARYDAETDQHHHLVCIYCDKVFDLKDERFNTLSLPDTPWHGFTVMNYSIHFRGVCSACREKAGPFASGSAASKSLDKKQIKRRKTKRGAGKRRS